jgi:RHH-type proline utilization regulon transcriptional repressor/proline dehydrogenase/delta 1-pyrroline-5-carboxylate dehydrogenase
LLVHEAIYDEFMHRFVGSCQALLVGDPTDPSTDVGPVIDAEAGAKVQRYIELGKREAKVLLADEQARPNVLGKPLIGPHVFEVTDAQHPLMTEEIFGPVVAVLKVKSFDEALAIANSSIYKLTGGVYTRTPSHLARAQKEFRVGNLYLNRPNTGALVGRHPFGGFGMSGGGTKAGGENYLLQFADPRLCAENTLRRGFAPELQS